MKKIKCFEYEASPYQLNKYIIRPIHENFYLGFTKGSFNVICARLFGLSYPEYLRMCRDKYKAEIVGKGALYPIAYFSLSPELIALVDQLNARANLVLWERENPDYEKHKAEMEKPKK